MSLQEVRYSGVVRKRTFEYLENRMKGLSEKVENLSDDETERRRFYFPNGRGIEVRRGPSTYGYGDGLLEVVGFKINPHRPSLLTVTLGPNGRFTINDVVELAKEHSKL